MTEPTIEQKVVEAVAWFEAWTRRTDWCVIDTETTGLAGNDQIIEVCIVSHAGEVLLDTLVRPTVAIKPDSTAIHGIDRKMVRDAPNWRQVRGQMIQRCRGLYVLAYNAGFDCRMVRQTNAAFGFKAPNKDAWKCVMNAFTDLNGERVNLAKAAGLAGIDIDDDHPLRHRAGFDAMLAWRLVQTIGFGL